jgi:hypothetical protein
LIKGGLICTQGSLTPGPEISRFPLYQPHPSCHHQVRDKLFPEPPGSKRPWPPTSAVPCLSLEPQAELFFYHEVTRVEDREKLRPSSSQARTMGGKVMLKAGILSQLLNETVSEMLSCPSWGQVLGENCPWGHRPPASRPQLCDSRPRSYPVCRAGSPGGSSSESITG